MLVSMKAKRRLMKIEWLSSANARIAIGHYLLDKDLPSTRFPANLDLIIFFFSARSVVPFTLV